MSLKSLVGGNETQKPWYTKSIMPASIKEALTNKMEQKNKKADFPEKKIKSKVDKKERKRDLKR